VGLPREVRHARLRPTGRDLPAQLTLRPGRGLGHLPKEVQQDIIEKQLKVYVIDATQVAHDTGMGRRINTIMQTCFFAISGVLPRDEAIAQIKEAIEKTYGMKGDEIVQLNYRAVDGNSGQPPRGDDSRP
jgi:hypothetical protein